MDDALLNLRDTVHDIRDFLREAATRADALDAATDVPWPAMARLAGDLRTMQTLLGAIVPVEIQAAWVQAERDREEWMEKLEAMSY